MADNSDARFEFRCWARNFGMVETRIRRFSECHGIRESNEIYVVSLANNDTNIKIRDDDLELKSLIKKQDNLEQWSHEQGISPDGTNFGGRGVPAV